MKRNTIKDAISVAVIGVGSIGRNHARVYMDLPRAHLVAIADTNVEIAQRIAHKYGVRAYANYRQMLDMEAPEAVSIATPTALHEAATQAALEAGAHVLVEKPITDTLEAGERLIQLAKNHRRKLMVGHIVRFNPAIQELKARLRVGELGRIFQIACRRVGPFPERIRDVGVVIDLATHDLDLIRYLIGMDPVRVFAETQRQIHTQHEDMLLALLRFPDQMTGVMEINWLTPTKVREIIVLGEGGMLRVDDLTQDIYFYENTQAFEPPEWPTLGNLKGVSEGVMIRYPLQRDEPLKAELQAFLNSILQEQPVPVSGEDGLAALRLALAIVESGRTHQVIEL